MRSFFLLGFRGETPAGEALDTNIETIVPRIEE